LAAHLFGERAAVSFVGTEDFSMRQSSDSRGGSELGFRVDLAAEDRNPAGVLPAEMFGPDAARGACPEFVNRAILKQYERLAGL
jgi:hypothetical protein